MRVRQRKRIFFGCEGASERSYVKFLQTLLDREGGHFHFRAEVAGGGDPLAIIENAAKALRRLERQVGKFDGSAVFLDRDKLGVAPTRDAKINRLARAARIKILWQNQDHEAYLLRHIVGQENRIVGAGRSTEVLQAFWGDYVKPVDAIWLLERLTAADWRRMLSRNSEHRRFFEEIGVQI